MDNAQRHHNFRRRAACLAVAACVASGIAQANPTSPTVVSGSATFSSSGSKLTVTNSPSAIIHWQSFGIGAGETVQFVQQSAASSVLNRVTGGNVSQILGTLQSNGKVFLINPAGIVFGQGATVDVGGLAASTLNMSDADFLAGRMRFNADTATPGSVSNAGQISTPGGGFVWLLAPDVENSGILHTPSGEAVLAAGYSIELVDSVNPDQRVVVSARSEDINLSQMMTANGGNIFSVLNSGTVSANTVVAGEEGRIYFKSAGDIRTTALSVAEARGDQAADGGRIQAFAAGDGLYAGVFDVTGRSGGFVETSGSYLDVNRAQIRMSALNPAGAAGTWLIDPLEILISTTGTCPVGFSCINPGVITTALTSGNFSILTNDGSISVESPVNAQAGNTNDLTLTAANDINVLPGGSIDMAGGDLTLDAGGNVTVGDTLHAYDIRISGQLVDVSGNGTLDADHDIAIRARSFNTNSAVLTAANLLGIDASEINILSGSNLFAEYIGLNSRNFQTGTPVFFSSASNAEITVFASTLNADTGLSFLASNVSLQGGSDMTAQSVLHGVAQDTLTVDDSTLGGATSTRLEVGNQFLIRNAAFVTADTALYFDFPLLGDNGWSVDGVPNAIFDINTGSQLMVGNNLAILGNGFFVSYISPLIARIVNQTFGQTTDATTAWVGFTPVSSPDFPGYDPGARRGSLCTGTGSRDLTCASADAGSSIGPDSQDGKQSAIGEQIALASQDNETVQTREPQECR